MTKSKPLKSYAEQKYEDSKEETVFEGCGCEMINTVRRGKVIAFYKDKRCYNHRLL